jgi:RNA polymerase sigma-70 factor, ECF subfamily
VGQWRHTKRGLFLAPPYYHVHTGGSLTTFSFDSEYMRRLAEGDPSVEEHFTTYFGRLLVLKLRARVRSAQLAEDMKQETFLRVLKQIRTKGGIDQPERLGGFVNSVCERVILEFFRSESRHPQVCEAASDPPDSTIDLESALVDDERKRMVHSVLSELSGKDRTILRMVFLEDVDKDEVCAAMRVNRGYLRVLLHRARQRLKKVMLERDSAEKMRAGD